jgi:Na+/melibiose symporter-like transporter
MLEYLQSRVRHRLIGSGHSLEQMEKLFTCGTLRYTPASLTVLFGWLLWGDFTFTLMEAEPKLMVMQARDYHLSAATIAFLLTTLATVCNFCLNPVISSWSDRYRSRWGRRRPFLMIATPFVAISLILVPWAPQITEKVMATVWGAHVLSRFPAAPIVIVFGVLVLCFRMVNLFITTVYYYLIPDTVPEPLIGRFYGLFRTVGILAGMIWNLLIFPIAHQHLHAVYATFAILYAVSFTVMCLKVREGEYPQINEPRGHWYSGIVNYVQECFGSKRYWIIFLVYGFMQWGMAAEVFAYLFYTEKIKLTDTSYGRLLFSTQVVFLLLASPFGALVDRLGSQRTLMIALGSSCLVGLTAFFAIHGYWSAMVFGVLVAVPAFLAQLTLGKWTVDMYPRAQYGQFASAAAAVGALGAAFLSPCFGWLVDTMDHYYRLCLIIPPIFNACSLATAIILYCYFSRSPVEQVPAERGFEVVALAHVASAGEGDGAPV